MAQRTQPGDFVKKDYRVGVIISTGEQEVAGIRLDYAVEVLWEDGRKTRESICQWWYQTTVEIITRDEAEKLAPGNHILNLDFVKEN